MKFSIFTFNIVLAVLWCFVWGSFDIYTLAAGFVVGYGLLGLVTRTVPGAEPYGRKVFRLFGFGIYFIKILIKANLQVAWEIVTPGLSMTPRIIRYDVSDLNAVQITSLANAITLTPGTLSVDVSDNEQNLYVHCMYAQDPGSATKEIDELRDRIMQGVFS